MYSEVEQSHLRYALRVYFIVGMFILAIIGNQCCKCAAKLDLLKGKQVHLYRMTGWLHPKETIYCIWKLKRLPGGLWLGLMMCVASLVTIAADFATNSVKAVPTMGRCEFDRGLVVSFDQEKAVFWSPPSNSYPAFLAQNAQTVSVKNHCDIGIYKKIPSNNDLKFCAGVEDIYGSWQCGDMNLDHTFDPENTTSEIEEYFVKNGIHDDSTYIDDYVGDDFGHTEQLLAWSMVNGNTTTTPFHIRVSIDMNITMDTLKTMKSFECNLTAPTNETLQGLITINEGVNISLALNDWASGLNAKVYNGTGAAATDNITQLSRNISQYLNAFTMVQGGSNSVINTTQPGDLPLYGCVAMRTYLSPGVIFLACFSGLILLVTTTYYITLLALLGKHGIPSCCARRKNNSTELNLDSVPDSTLSWMLHASRERSIGTDVEEGGRLLGVPNDEEDLRYWSFALVDSGNGLLRLVRAGEKGPIKIEGGSHSPPAEQVPLSATPKGS